MKNPYKSRSFRARRNSSKLGYVLASVLAFPIYIGWQLSRLVPRWLSGCFGGGFALLTTPFRPILFFVKRWTLTRSWVQLLLASPLLLAMIWIASIIFLTNNRGDEEIFADYQSGVLSSAGAGDYDRADFLAGKLLHKAAFARDERMLFAAMLAAHETENMPRRDMLIKRLTGELQHIETHLWYARQLLATGDSEDDHFLEALQHVLTALKLSDDPAPIRIELAKMCYKSKRSEMAANLLEESTDPDPKTSILLAKLCIANELPQKAYEMVTRVLERIDVENPQKDRYLAERIDVFTVLAETQRQPVGVVESLLEVAAQLESKAILAPDDELIKSQLTQAYMVVGNVLSQQVDEESRRKSLVYFQKSVAVGRVPHVMGALVLEASNLDAHAGLTQQQMRDALVRGEGPAMAHLFLGLDAWKKNLMPEAELHIRLAHALEPNSLTVVEYVVMHIVQLADDDTARPFRMSLDTQPLWRRSLRLLDMVSKLDQEKYEGVLYTKCVILAKMQHWNEVVGLAESFVSEASDDYRLRFLNLLVRAYGESGDLAKAAEYRNQSKAEMSRIRADRSNTERE
ncbi:MAG: hypothetical protein KJO21_12295 [Verrucomicrobiae bacterium]|nr:hypothetical protein [Verrucomicrobiae bacterium]NNJ43999.1 hypothetical protein [Akkermansiaceae bacterium]